VIATTKRKIVQIDEEKCDGCGECVPSCAEGAIQIIDGKARLVSDVYCDGLGACLGNCPQGAISIIEREAAPFDEQAVESHLASAANRSAHKPASGCPSASVSSLNLRVLSNTPAGACPGASDRSQLASAGPLANWPIQLHLVPPNAPFLQQADLLLVADCVPVACADFHQRFVDRNPIVIGCPKLDDSMQYVQKLAQMIRASSLKSLAVLIMEVPCCTGLLRIAEAAIKASGVDIPLRTLVVSTRGELLSTS
jgi:Fe-S-cluster-containing hydrogenase component 2